LPQASAEPSIKESKDSRRGSSTSASVFAILISSAALCLQLKSIWDAQAANDEKLISKVSWWVAPAGFLGNTSNSDIVYVSNTSTSVVARLLIFSGPGGNKELGLKRS
jgi:hypothetical protein